MEVSAGTAAKQDASVRVFDESAPLRLEINSVVSGLFGKALRSAAEAELSRMNVTRGRVLIDDHQALDFVIRARIQAAVLAMREAGGDV